jgi:hypothetical protein
MPKLWRGLLLFSVLWLVVSSVAAQDTSTSTVSGSRTSVLQQRNESDSASIRIIPDTGHAGDSHVILVAGLTNGEGITIRILYDGDEVYSSDRIADDRGRVELNIFTSLDDPTGVYTIEVLNASGDVIASTSLTVLESVGLNGNIEISPSEAEAGTVFTIEISDVRQFADLQVRFRNAEGTVVYTALTRADVDGFARAEFPSESIEAGIYRVSVVLDHDPRVELASSEITILEHVFDITTLVEPAEIRPGRDLSISLRGSEAGASLTVEVRFEDETILSETVSADDAGLANWSFTVADDAAVGNYRVRVSQDGELVSQAEFIVFIPEFTVSISPEQGTPNTTFVVTIAGLEEGEEVTIELVGSGAVLQSMKTVGDFDGNARVLIGQRLRFELGTYAIRVIRDETIVFGQPITIAAQVLVPDAGIDPEKVLVTVTPESGTIPTTYTFHVEGVPASTALSISIVFEGQSVYTSSGTADENGVFETVVSSEPSDTEGSYTLEVRAQGEIIGSADFAIGEAPSESSDATQDSSLADNTVSIRLNPEALVRGERAEIIVNNLEAGETVTLELRYGNDVVFSTEGIAAANGTVSFGILTEETDPTGIYGVLVLRAEEVVANAALNIVASEDDIPESQAIISITPQSGSRGTDHTLTVTGLGAEESVEILVELDGETVFSLERSADKEGQLTVVLSSDSRDTPGEYTVRVLRNSGAEIATTLIIEAAILITDPQITIEPASGIIGTDHIVTVTNLLPDETIEFIIEYDGNELMREARQADENGIFSIALSTEEGDQVGAYDIIIVRQNGDEIAGVLIAERDETSTDFGITIEPDVVLVGESFDVLIAGLDANETVAITILFEDELLYEAEREADENGNIALGLVSEAGDPVGVTTIVVRRNTGDTVSADFELLGEDASVVDSTVEISIVPASGPIGTTHDVSVTGLEAGETVSLLVEFEGNKIYETELTANNDGIASTQLVSEVGDSFGEYRVSVLAQGVLVASASLWIEDGETTHPPLADDRIVLEPDLPVFTGRLDANTPSVEYTFYGETGQGVIINLSSGQFDAYLVLRDENGNELLTNDDGGDGFNSRIGPYLLPLTGEYTIVATSYNNLTGATVEGRFELSIDLVNIEDYQLELGAGNHFIRDSLSPNRPEISYIFVGEAGDSILISLNSIQFDTHLILRDEDGTELTRNDDASNSTNSQIGPYTLPYSGKYTVVVSSFGYTSVGEFVTGNFDLLIESVSILFGEYGQSIALEFNADKISNFIEFEGSAGDIISIDVNSDDTIDTVLSVLDSLGLTLIQDDDGGLGFDPEIMRFVLPQSGTYTVLIRAFTPSEVGTVTVTINLDDVHTLDNEVQTVRLNSKQSTDLLIFEGQAGETITLIVELESGNIGALNIAANQGDIPLMYYQTFGLPERIILGFAVTENGTVTIRVEDNGGGNSVLSMRIERE